MIDYEIISTVILLPLIQGLVSYKGKCVQEVLVNFNLGRFHLILGCVSQSVACLAADTCLTVDLGVGCWILARPNIGD